MAWYRTYLRTNRKRDSKTAKDCSLSNSLRVTENFFHYFFHYPRYPWEQKGSHGSCMVMVSPLVHPLRVTCCALCCTMPVFAEELEYREYIYFFSHPTVSPGWEVDSLWTPRKRQTGGQNRVELILRNVPLVNCEVDMVVLSSYCSLAT